jgi:hypothetical protein
MHRQRSAVFGKAIISVSLVIACAYTPISAIAETAASNDPAFGIAAALPINVAPVESGSAADELTRAPGGNAPTAKLESPANEVKVSGAKSILSAGEQFPVTIQRQISSKTATVGDLVEAQLAVDLLIGDRLIAPKGETVFGHVIAVEKSRKLIKAEFASKKRWMHMAGSLGIQFDEIVTQKGEHIPLVAVPAAKAKAIQDTAEGRVLGVNDQGNLESPISGQVKAQALQMAIRLGAMAGGVFSLGAVPAAMACLGAISPSFVYCHPVGTDVKHRRLRGFGMGLVQGLPGGFIICDSIIRGPEATIEPGDVFQAQFTQDFTGEKVVQPAMPSVVHEVVRGQILSTQDN